MVKLFLDVLKMLEGMSMALRSVELYQFGLKLIQQLIQSNHSSCFTPRHWTMIVDTFDRIYTSYLPGDLSTLVTAVENQQVLEKSDSRLGRAAPHFDLSMSATSISAIDYYRRPNVSKDDDDDDEDIGILNALSEKCHAQLQLVEVFSILAVKLPNGQESIFSPISTITIDALQKFLDLLLSLYEFSVKFNSNVPLRELMTQAKFAESFEQLKLTRQETTSLGLLVELTFDFYKRALLIRDQLPCLKDDRAASYDMGMRYFEISTTILRRYIEMRLPDASPKRIGKSWTLLASTVLRQWMQLMEIISKRDKSIPKDLLNITEVKVGMLVEIALELYPLVESNHHLREQSHEFILNTTKQLIEYRRNVM